MKNVLLDLVFPPICLCCKEGIAERLFCPICQDLLTLLDPADRCRHCFEPVEGELCDQCRKDPELCFPRMRLFDPSPPAWILKGKMEEMRESLASLALLFFHRLELDPPDLIIPIPEERGSKAFSQVAAIFAKMLGRPSIPLLRRRYFGLLQPQLILTKIKVKEEQTLLLFDCDSTTSWLKEACNKTSEIFPKQATILSLF